MHLRSRWPVTILTVTLAIFVAAVGFLSQVDQSKARQDATFNISVVDFAFEPAALTVPVGATVTWTNDGSRPHTVTADDGSFDSGRLDPGEQFRQTFDQPGTFSYHCGFHPEMQGSIAVAEPQEPAGASADATPAANESASSESEAAAGTVGTTGNLPGSHPCRHL
jgi:plastocyanin